MAARKTGKRRKAGGAKPAPATGLARRLAARIWRLVWRSALVVAIVLTLWVISYRVINPPITAFIWSETRAIGSRKWDWTPIEDIPPHVLRALVAAEDANFCRHWGFDMAAIRAAIGEGEGRGASTISQQVAKNAFLFHQRSWLRKGLEAGFTLLVEATWPKHRILEVYANIAEFDRGVFGVTSAAEHYFGQPLNRLSRTRAARLAATLPNPKNRSASNPTPQLAQRANQILSGADTIRLDGRADCFGGSET